MNPEVKELCEHFCEQDRKRLVEKEKEKKEFLEEVRREEERFRQALRDQGIDSNSSPDDIEKFIQSEIEREN